MDVYVLSKLWDHGAGIVLSAGASLDNAKEIARRWETEPFEWGEWVDDPGPGVRAQRWTREARIGGTVLPHGHEIVCVPLAGYVADWPILSPIDETGPALRRSVPALTRRREIEEIGRLFGAP